MFISFCNRKQIKTNKQNDLYFYQQMIDYVNDAWHTVGVKNIH